MYRDRGGGGGASKAEIMGGPSSSLDRKRINDALDKHLEKSSPSTSRGLKDKSSAGVAAVPSTSAGMGGGSGKLHQQLDHRDTRSTSTLTSNKIKASDG